MGVTKRQDSTQVKTAEQSPDHEDGAGPSDETPEGLSTLGFLNLAGHELRAPVTALKGQIQLMQRRLRREGGRERDEESLARMLYQAERMQQFVAVYLDTAYNGRGELSLLRQPRDLIPLVERIVTLYGIASSDHPMRLETAEMSLEGQFDPSRIELVVRELLGNALKYTTPGEVVVRVARVGAQAWVEVEDAGPAIPQAYVETIFTPYVTIPEMHNSGLGLGLAIAREVTRLHGGEMGLRRGKRGNLFWFTLPLSESLGDDTTARALDDPSALR